MAKAKPAQVTAPVTAAVQQVLSASAQRVANLAREFVKASSEVKAANEAVGLIRTSQFDRYAAALGSGEVITEKQYLLDGKKAVDDVLLAEVAADRLSKVSVPIMSNSLMVFALAYSESAVYPRRTIDGKPEHFQSYVSYVRPKLVADGKYHPTNKGGAKAGKRKAKSGPVVTIDRGTALALLANNVPEDIVFLGKLITAENMPKLKAMATMLGIS